MIDLALLVPIALSGACWYGVFKINRSRHWLRFGEVIFWDVILLIVIGLVWLRWF
jgi:hypothetical protein